MKLLVTADSHGRADNLCAAIREHPDLSAFIFLGDGVADLESVKDLPELQGKKTVAIWGNVDPEDAAPQRSVDTFGTHQVFSAHGYNERCKHGIENFFLRVKYAKCDIGLFGHTHCPFYLKLANVHLFNPGPMVDGNYGVIEVDGDNLTFTHYRLSEDGPSEVIESPNLLQI